MFRTELRPEIWLSMNSLRALHLRVRELREPLLEGGQIRVGLAALHDHERVEVARLLVEAVPRPRRDRHRAERRSAGRRLEDPLDHEPLLFAVRERQLDRRAEAEIVILRVVRRHERAVVAEVGEHGIRPLLPVDREDPARRRVDCGRVEVRSPNACASPARTLPTASTPGACAPPRRR